MLYNLNRNLLCQMLHKSRLTENQRTKAINDSYHRLYRKLNSEQAEYVGNYQIIRLIGEGSFGKVYMAIHKLTRTRVVLKSGSKTDSNFIREIFFHKQAFHANITKLYEVVVLESKVYLAIEYCAGGELFDYFLTQNCQLSLWKIREIFSQIVSAVCFIHSLNISHRDLKLENILLDKKDNCKLADFGFSRDCFKNSNLKTICGTTVYMAPELLLVSQGKLASYNGFKIDYWALGVILYTLLFGEMPFEDDDEEIVKYTIINNQPNYDSRTVRKSVLNTPNSSEDNIPEDAIELCKMLLEKNPAKRPQSLEYVLKHKFLDPVGSKALKYTKAQVAFTQNFASLQFLLYFEKHLLKHLKRLGFDTKKIKDSVVERKCDQLDAIWYLLLAKENKRAKIKEKFKDKEKNGTVGGLIGSGKRLSQFRNSLTKDLSRSVSGNLNQANENIDKDASYSPLQIQRIVTRISTSSASTKPVVTEESIEIKEPSDDNNSAHDLEQTTATYRKSTGNLVREVPKRRKSKAFIDKLKFWVNKSTVSTNNDDGSNTSSGGKKSDIISNLSSKRSSFNSVLEKPTKNINDLKLSLPADIKRVRHKRSMSLGQIGIKLPLVDTPVKKVDGKIDKTVLPNPAPGENENPNAKAKAKPRPGSMISTHSTYSQFSDLSQPSFSGTVLSMDTPTNSNFAGTAGSISSSFRPNYKRSKSVDSKSRHNSGLISSGSYSPSTSEQSSRRSSFYDYSTGSLTHRSGSPDPFGDPLSKYNVLNLSISKQSEPDSPTQKISFTKYNTGKKHSRANLFDTRYSTRRKSPLGSPYADFGLRLRGLSQKNKKHGEIKTSKPLVIEEEETENVSTNSLPDNT